MKVSLNHVKEYLDFELLPVGELVQKIGAQLGAVEEVVDLGKKYQGIVVAKVVSCEKHPDADKLQVCTIDIGDIILDYTPDVKRDGSGHVQVVCAAPNVRPGIFVAWLPPGTIVPATADKDPFMLEAREIRGQLSNGMLASAKELDLGDSHDGILELDGEKPVQPGDDFAKTYGLDDHIIDIENKMFTHRPDCFGVLGVAREIAGIQQKPFKSPDWYLGLPQYDEANELNLSVRNELPDDVPRFMAVAMSGVIVKPSPVWLQAALRRAGLKPINNVVDITNYMMYLTGQPLHAYDYDKVKDRSDGDPALVVRRPQPGEKVKLLNGKEIKPRAEAIMIATDRELVGIGGVMGGTDTEVDNQTMNIILECATFDMYSIRRTSMEHGLFTDASTRFTKGQSPQQNSRVTVRAMQLLNQLAGAVQASKMIDVLNSSMNSGSADDALINTEITVSSTFINNRLGLRFTDEEIANLLRNVEFESDGTDNGLKIYAPFWRTDIELREDIVEEVGRLHGYDKLPLELPQRDLTPAVKDPLLELKASIRAQLRKAGANEVLTYSFAPGSLMDKAVQDKEQAFQISNALSPDLQYYRMSLIPSLLEKIRPNIKAGYDEFAVFEIGKAHVLYEPDPFEPAVPKEVNSLALVYASRHIAAGAPYYQAKKYLMSVLEGFQGVTLVKLEPLQGADLYKNPWIEQMTAPFEPARAAVLRDGENFIWGVVGEFKASVRRQLKLPEHIAGFEIDPLLLGKNSAGPSLYVPLPRFPKVTQDITLQVNADVAYQELFNLMEAEVAKAGPENTLSQLEPVDIYQADDDSAHKRVTLRVSIASHDRTLTDTEVNTLLDRVTEVIATGMDVRRV